MRSFAILFSALLLAGPSVLAQESADPHAQHQHTMTLFPPREGSGTAWVPDETPMFGVMRTFGPWTAMFHGSALGQVIYEPGEIHRTGGFSTKQASSVNWGMVMLRRPVGTGRLGFRAMASLEPATVPGCGYLSLLASGEVCDGDTIHDRQHPHDFIMELAAEYERPVTANLTWQVYAGLAGEPALGPVAFPHRLSAMSNPIAPIAHHWLDSTHITYGVVTAGVFGKTWKAESSIFNGREPDEHRWDLDLAAMDSFSGRFTYAPTPRLAVQVSAGWLNESEEGVGSAERADVKRFTASSTFHRGGADRVWATTLGYGVNSEREEEPTGPVDQTTHALMLETSLIANARDTWFGRAEIAGKSAHDLHAHEFPGEVFTVAKLQAGYIRTFPAWKSLVPGIGSSVTLNFVPRALEVQYDGRVRTGLSVFFSLRPARHGM